MNAYRETSQATPQAPSIWPVGCCAMRPREARSKSSGSIATCRDSVICRVCAVAAFGSVLTRTV